MCFLAKMWWESEGKMEMVMKYGGNKNVRDQQKTSEDWGGTTPERRFGDLI